MNIDIATLISKFAKSSIRIFHNLAIFVLNCYIQIKLGSQYHFYMEAQTTLAVPDEDNCMVVYSASQCPENAHATIAKCLGIPQHNVRMITRRVGGGFGGKAIKAMYVSI